MLQGELDFFRAVHQQCTVIVDVGARFDTDYTEIAQGRGCRFFLFEPNPRFYAKLTRNLKRYREDVRAESMAVGDDDGSIGYFEDAESVLRHTTGVANSISEPRSIRLTRLDTYCMLNGIDHIDFLKTDIEEYDYFALLGAGDLLPRCRFIQIELGINAPLAKGVVTNEHYYTLLEPHFDLYIVRDENNPLWRKGSVTGDLIRLDAVTKAAIDKLQPTGVGFNLAGVNRAMNPDLGKLVISSLGKLP